MKKKTLILMIIILLLLFSVVILEFVLAGGEEGTQLYKGKNYLKINQTLYANELISLNPNIESVSYFDEFLNRSIGYVNIFGGVGSNFLIKQEQIYEISVSKNTSLIAYQIP